MSKILISGDILRKIAKTLSPARADRMAGLLNTVCPRYGINTPDIFHEFLAQVLHESGEFRAKVENMNYSAQGLVNTWPSRFKTLEAAKPFARNPEALANLVYGGRMGNTKPGDGWLNRGRGFIGITGGAMYEAYAKYLNMPVDKVRELVGTDDMYALDSACWFFSVHKGLNDEAERDEQDKITKSINGGFIGKKSRDEYYELCKKYIA